MDSFFIREKKMSDFCTLILFTEYPRKLIPVGYWIWIARKHLWAAESVIFRRPMPTLGLGILTFKNLANLLA